MMSVELCLLYTGGFTRKNPYLCSLKMNIIFIDDENNTAPFGECAEGRF